MTQPIIRIYDSETQATKAANHLRGEGYANLFQFSGPSGKGATSAAARNALVASMTAAHIWKSHAEVYADRLTKGKSLLMVHAPFGRAHNATQVLDSYGPSEVGVVEKDGSIEFGWDEAAPLSSALLLPVLAQTRHPFETLTGIPSLSKGKAFFSGCLGFPLLKDGAAKRNTSMGFRMLSSSATPLSSAIGMRTLSQNPTPLSSLLGLKVLSSRK
jgi:hypothetical protein